jgi:excisionase family DNA binding protein
MVGHRDPKDLCQNIWLPDLVDVMTNRSTQTASITPAGSTRPEPTRREPFGLRAEDILTVTELATLLRMPKSTVGYLARNGTLPSVKLGRRRFFIRDAIERILIQVSE